MSNFQRRHIGPGADEISSMLETVGYQSLDELADATLPSSIRLANELELEPPMSEAEAVARLKEFAAKNKVFRSYIGEGFYNTHTPSVIQRNILENPGWYTQYTPYQAEIAQGRLEALINFQTLVCDLTGMKIANSSLLDEGTAAAEAMTLAYRVKGSAEKNKFFVSKNCHSHVIEVVRGRAEPLGIELVFDEEFDESLFGALIQYPTTDGAVNDYSAFANLVHEKGALLVASADLLSLALLKAPGEWGADVVVGNTQRFGVPLGFGGPHAAYIATDEKYKRDIPGRIVGVSKDKHGKIAYRLALQTREQHIRREKATSNICTAQVLLAIMASMYAVYHGPDGIREIAKRVKRSTETLASGLRKLGFQLKHQSFFDTLRVEGEGLEEIKVRAKSAEMNFREYSDGSLGISLDETTSESDLEDILVVFAGGKLDFDLAELWQSAGDSFPEELRRETGYLSHEVFNSYHSETEILRYIKRLEAKDLSLTSSMIPLGSCTMKLNATTEMLAVTWPEFAGIHPFAPVEQASGYLEMLEELEDDLCKITGFDAVSLQPNAGSQGEYAGLLVIQKYHREGGEAHRNICLIPASAHGTNPASAIMAGMKVVVVKCDERGDIDLEDLEQKVVEHKDNLSALMVTYPSTHGVFEKNIKFVCNLIHENGGQVYMDGANLNAQVALCNPAEIGADVCHINLHKTFCIPHGGGGPGMGPIAVAKHLAEFLPTHFTKTVGGESSIPAVSSAPWGSACILPISWSYIKMMGAQGLKRATQVAILNANYIAKNLEAVFPVLYKGKNGNVAHECILDFRRFKREVGVEVADVAKRLIDYGFHAPTVAWPVMETLMVEPTESESKAELDRFCDAMRLIAAEISEVKSGAADKTDNVLKNAPHTDFEVSADEWSHPYSRRQAAFPAEWLVGRKFWPPVARIDNAYGDRNLFCSCA